MNKMLGIVNFESAYVKVNGMGDFRPIPAFSFLGRYRVIDFVLSNMTNSGIEDIKVQIRNRPRSLIEHINRTDYNINSKKGRIHLLYGERNIYNDIYNTDIAALDANRQWIEESHCEYVVIAPSHFVYTQDYNEMLEELENKKADIVMLYQSINDADENFVMCDTVEFDKNKKVNKLARNYAKYKNEDISLETYVMKKDMLLKLIDLAKNISSLYTLANVIRDLTNDLKIVAYKHKGFASGITSLKAYYDCSMELNEDSNLHSLINEEWPIYTMTNDTCPTLYKKDARVSGSTIGNGCIIEGTVINSIISRNVIIEKGAYIKDAVVLPDAVIGQNAHIEKAVIDRFATVSHIVDLKGDKNEPIYVKRGDRI